MLSCLIVPTLFYMSMNGPNVAIAPVAMLAAYPDTALAAPSEANQIRRDHTRDTLLTRDRLRPSFSTKVNELEGHGAGARES
jgi:hypothetical protein